MRFGPGVSPQTHVDWHSGDNWESTMQEALAPKHLRAVTKGNVVEIVSDDPQAAARPVAARPTRRVADSRRAPAARMVDDSDLEPAPVLGIPQLAPPIVSALPYPNAPAASSPPAAPAMPPPSYAPPQSYAVAPAAANPMPATAVLRPAVPNYDPPITATPRSYGNIWHAEANTYLNETISRWCAQAGGGWAPTRLRPSCISSNTDLKFRLTNSITITDTFENAVVALVNNIHTTVPPYAFVHPLTHTVELTDAEHLSQSGSD